MSRRRQHRRPLDPTRPTASPGYGELHASKDRHGTRETRLRRRRRGKVARISRRRSRAPRSGSPRGSPYQRGPCSKTRSEGEVPTSRTPEEEERARACPGVGPGPITPVDKSRPTTCDASNDGCAAWPRGNRGGVSMPCMTGSSGVTSWRWRGIESKETVARRASICSRSSRSGSSESRPSWKGSQPS